MTSDRMEQALRAIAVRLKWRMADVRSLVQELEADGVHVSFVPTTGELCPECAAHLATEEGLCVQCLTERDLLEQRHRLEDEAANLEAKATRARNALKQERKRLRQDYGANPRRKFDWGVVAAYAAEHPEEWEEVSADIEAVIAQGTLTP